ncbi:hypothetical protein IW261DRAFT_1005924 [Armillaria novae-zelandiae]|uniref:Uncharacterized protein n=1 Tax=Armillaria novae-zelandiae TaxID=153914 RepID=A0AA39TUH6_9AGAR|nr:hypothetical protein IW261DRAFT_1005924 [Armillaria novae-zelandiae]
MFHYTRVSGSFNEEHHNFDAATEETLSKTQGETAIDDAIELLLRSSIPLVSQEDPPRPLNRRGRAPDSLIFGESEETTDDASRSSSQEEPVDLSTILSILNAECQEEDDFELDFVPIDNPEESIPASFRLPDAQPAPSGCTPTGPKSNAPFSQPVPQTAPTPIPQSNDCTFPTQPSPTVIVHDATEKTQCDTEMEHSNPPPRNSFNESISEDVQFVSSSSWHAPIMPPSSSFQSPPRPPPPQPSSPELSLGELQQQLADAVIQAVANEPAVARGSMDIQHAHQMIAQIVYATLEQYPRLWEIQTLLSVQLSDVETLAVQVVAQFLAMAESVRLQNQQVHQLAATPIDTSMHVSVAPHEDNSRGLGASPKGCPEVAVEQEQECQQHFASDFQFMKLKDGLPSIPQVPEVPAFVLQFRETYPLLEDEAIWKIVMWFHPELHGRKTLGDTFVLREDAVRAALREVRHWRFPSSDAGWSISADEFFLSSERDVLARNVLFVEQEAGTNSTPSTPSPPPTPDQEILPLGEVFQEHQDIHMEDHEDLYDNWDFWRFDPEPKWSEIYVPSYDPEMERDSAGQTVPFDQSYYDYQYDYHYDYPYAQYEQPYAPYEESYAQYEHSHAQYEQPRAAFDQTPVQQKPGQPYASSKPSPIQRDQQKDRQSPGGLAGSLRRLLRTCIRKNLTETMPEPRRPQQPARISQQPSRLTPQNSRDSWDYYYGSPDTVLPESIYGLDQASPQNPHQFQDERDGHLEPEPPFDLDREPPEDRRYPQGYPHYHTGVGSSHSDSSSSDSETGRDIDQESDNGPPLPGQPSSVCVHRYLPWSASTL